MQRNLKFITGFTVSQLVLLSGLVLTGGCRSSVMGERRYVPEPVSDSYRYDDTAITTVPPPNMPAETAFQSAALPAEEPETTIPAEVTTQEKPAGKKYPAFDPSTIKEAPATPAVTPKTSPVAASSNGGSYTVKKNDSLWKIAKAHGVTVANLAACNNLSEKSVLRVGQTLQIPAAGAKIVTQAAPAGDASKPTKPQKESSGSAPSHKAEPLPADGVYVVKKNDSVWLIAKRFQISSAEIIKLNNLPANPVLQIGQKLKMPNAPAGTTTTTANTPKITPQPTDSSNVGDILGGATGGTAAPAVSTPSTPVTPTTETPSTGAEVPTDPVITNETIIPVDVERDTTVEALAKDYNIKAEDLYRVNPDLPSDGQLKAKSLILIPIPEN